MAFINLYLSLKAGWHILDVVMCIWELMTEFVIIICYCIECWWMVNVEWMYRCAYFVFVVDRSSCFFLLIEFYCITYRAQVYDRLSLVRRIKSHAGFRLWWTHFVNNSFVICHLRLGIRQKCKSIFFYFSLLLLCLFVKSAIVCRYEFSLICLYLHPCKSSNYMFVICIFFLLFSFSSLVFVFEMSSKWNNERNEKPTNELFISQQNAMLIQKP